MRDSLRLSILVVLVAGCHGKTTSHADLAVVDQTVSSDGPADDLASTDLVGVDLAGVDLAGVDLAGVDLAGVDLAAVDLKVAGTDLSGHPDLSGVMCVTSSGPCTTPTCGTACCGLGEYCDNGTCHCGAGPACSVGTMCAHSGPPSAGESVCGSICCGGKTPCPL